MVERDVRDSPAFRMRCRYCSSRQCHRATRHGWQDFLFRVLGMYPWRCDRCGARFHSHKRSAANTVRRVDE